MAFDSQTLAIASNVLANTLLSPRDYFLGMMETWLATPKTNQTQWVVMIENFPEEVSKGMLGAIADSATNLLAGFGIGESNLNTIQRLEGTTGDADGWNQTLVGSMLGGWTYQNIMGCIFATDVDIPELDANTANDISVQNSAGFKHGTYTSGRNGFANTPLSISFRETNSSFGDLIIKPWSLLTAHYGLLPFHNHKTNIIIMEYAKTYQKITQIPSKIWQFEGCAPISVPGEKLDYYDTDKQLVKTTKWVFTNYYIRHNMYLPIVDALQKSSFNRVWNSNIF